MLKLNLSKIILFAILSVLSIMLLILDFTSPITKVLENRKKQIEDIINEINKKR